MKEEKKIAVLFPGIGYTNERPLLYYAKKLAQKQGFDILPLNYTGFQNPKDVIGKAGALKASFELAYTQSEDILQDVNWKEYSRILFISKSVGTAAAAAYAKRHALQTENIYYTPVEGTFLFMREKSGIAFHGTADPWADNAMVEENCRRFSIPLFVTEHGNHSLETGDVLKDIDQLKQIMSETEAYITREDA
ncbi:MAG: hypothetical protein SOI52_03110 [Erysipelotrichaceae bacterium]|jgi:hypothetical protein